MGPNLCSWQYLMQIALTNIEVYVLCVCEILQNTILGLVVTSSLTGTHFKHGFVFRPAIIFLILSFREFLTTEIKFRQ